MRAKRKKNNKFTRTIEKVYSIMSHTRDFMGGSDEEKLSMILSYLLGLGVPYHIAIRIAYRIVEKSIHRKAYIQDEE